MSLFECMDFTDWVQVSTQIITTITAVIMSIFAYFTYIRSPKQEPEPEEGIAETDYPEELTLVVVFVTKKQKTKLKVTSHGLECHLDDTRKGKGGHQWTIRKVEAQQILRQNMIHINPGYRANTGTFSIGRRRNWIYSKKLYPEPDYLYGVLKQLLNNSINFENSPSTK